MINFKTIILSILIFVYPPILWAQPINSSLKTKTKEANFYASYIINTALEYGPTRVAVKYKPDNGTEIFDTLTLGENTIAKGGELNFGSLRNNVFGFRGGIAYSVGKDAVNLLEFSFGPNFRLIGKKKFKVIASAIGVLGSGGLHLGTSKRVWDNIEIRDTEFISDDVDMSFRNGFWGAKPGLHVVQKFGKRNKFGLELYGGYRFAYNTVEWVLFSGETFDGDDEDDEPDYATETLRVDNESLIVKTTDNRSDIIKFKGPEFKVSLVVTMR